MDEFQGKVNRDGGGVQRPVESDAGILRNKAEMTGGESVADSGIGVFVIVVCLAGVNAAGEDIARVPDRFMVISAEDFHMVDIQREKIVQQFNLPVFQMECHEKICFLLFYVFHFCFFCNIME